MNKQLKILFAGESVMVQTLEYKGHDYFSTIRYGESNGILKRLFTDNGYELTHIPCHRIPFDFPRTSEELSVYDIVMFSDVGSNTFLLLPEMTRFGKRVPNLLSLVKKFVNDGGGFCMIGGYMTFQGIDGKGKWKDSIIEEILPVSCIYGDDRKEVPEGADLGCKPNTHPIVTDMPEKWPYILGYNKTILKDGANLHVSFNNDPIIASWSYGNGRVVAFTTDCAPHWAPAAFNEWEYYPKLWGNISNWLSKRV